jgi:dTDP-L-rhamnose 4-epimerase
VHVDDVARAFLLALERPEAAGQVVNIGSGQHRSVLDVAQRLAATLGRPDLEPEILGKARTGDIRHCFADIALAERLLGFRPEHDFAAGLGELAEWLAHQRAEDKVADARRELEARGLVA